jgi:hypothetical protein
MVQSDATVSPGVLLVPSYNGWLLALQVMTGTTVNIYWILLLLAMMSF